MALVDLAQQLRERDVLRRRALTWILEQREERQQQQDDDDPEGEIAQIGVHRFSFVVARIAALSPSDVSLDRHEGIPRSTIAQSRCRPARCQGNYARLFNPFWRDSGPKKWRPMRQVVKTPGGIMTDAAVPGLLFQPVPLACLAPGRRR